MLPERPGSGNGTRTHVDRAQLRQELSDGQGAVEALAPLSIEQLLWRPQAGSWSVGECLLHVNATTAAYLEAAERALEKAEAGQRWDEGPYRLGVVARWFVKSLEPPPGRRFRAPRRVQPQPAAGSVAGTVEDYLRLQRQAAELLDRGGAMIDLARASLRSPLLPLLTFSVAEALAINTAHQRRHVWQAQRVTQHSSFPGG